MTITETPYSSNVKWIGYEWKDRRLRVAFHNGGVYDYAEVPPEVYNDFRSQNSPGGYFHKHIKGAYATTKVE